MAKRIHKNKKFKGLAISSGQTVARVCVYSVQRHNKTAKKVLISENETKAELDRFEKALIFCSNELDTVIGNVSKVIGKTESEIFIAKKHIMNDPAINDKIKQIILEEKRGLEEAINEVYQEYENKFSNFDDEYFRERSSDIAEIRRRLLDYLSNTQPGFNCEGQDHCAKGNNRIIVAESLTADMMVHMNLFNIMGIVTEHGGISSHAAIIARSVGVPAVSGIKNIYKEVSCGYRILVDGDTGTVIVDPDEKTEKKYIPIDLVNSKEECPLTSPEGIEVFANASLIEDVKQAALVRADGIGLFRTEIAFMRAERVLTEDEQFELYSNIQNIMHGKPVTFRMLDVGGDKELPFLEIEKESNPYLGCRGSRFLLSNDDIFKSQAKALLRLSKNGPVRILFPMIIDTVQLKKLCNAVRLLIPQVDSIKENVFLGAMFEVPSACMQAEEIMELVDFTSIGSNDLIQYMFAVDRNNESVSDDYDPEHPVLWKILKNLCETAKEMNKPISICGEMAGRLSTPSKLLEVGFTSMSVSSRLVPQVRNEIVKYLDVK